MCTHIHTVLLETLLIYYGKAIYALCSSRLDADAHIKFILTLISSAQSVPICVRLSRVRKFVDQALMSESK